MADTKVKMKLQGHEKFPVREGWINKALSIVPEQPDIFLRKDATDMFGIGSNMVKSLRYWMKAFGLITEKASYGAKLTEIGEIIAQYDPYIENPVTLWVLHSYIAKNKEEATTWFMYFNHCDAEDLDKQEVETILLREMKIYAAGQNFSEKSLDNDIDVMLNMYSRQKEKTDPEDKNVSPFSRLGLIKNVNDRYSKTPPNKKNFSEILVLYELILMVKDGKGISIEEAVFGENGLTRLFNLTSIMANDYFDRLDAKGYIHLDRTAGLDMIYFLKSLEATKVLEDYYKNC